MAFIHPRRCPLISIVDFQRCPRGLSFTLPWAVALLELRVGSSLYLARPHRAVTLLLCKNGPACGPRSVCRANNRWAARDVGRQRQWLPWSQRHLIACASKCLIETLGAKLGCLACHPWMLLQQAG